MVLRARWTKTVYLDRSSWRAPCQSTEALPRKKKIRASHWASATCLLNRLQGLLQQLKQTLSILREYDNIIQDQVKKGIIDLLWRLLRPWADSITCHTMLSSALIRLPLSYVLSMMLQQSQTDPPWMIVYTQVWSSTKGSWKSWCDFDLSE